MARKPNITLIFVRAPDVEWVMKEIFDAINTIYRLNKKPITIEYENSDLIKLRVPGEGRISIFALNDTIAEIDLRDFTGDPTEILESLLTRFEWNNVKWSC